MESLKANLMSSLEQEEGQLACGEAVRGSQAGHWPKGLALRSQARVGGGLGGNCSLGGHPPTHPAEVALSARGGLLLASCILPGLLRSQEL